MGPPLPKLTGLSLLPFYVYLHSILVWASLRDRWLMILLTLSVIDTKNLSCAILSLLKVSLQLICDELYSLMNCELSRQQRLAQLEIYENSKTTMKKEN